MRSRSLALTPGGRAELSLHQRGKIFSPLHIRGVPVETGAPRRQNDRIARGGHARCRVDGRAHRPGLADGSSTRECPRHLGGGLPNRHNGPHRWDRAGQFRQVEALVAPSGDQYDRRKAPNSGLHRGGGGRLRVVVPGNPVFFGYELDPVRRHRRRAGRLQASLLCRSRSQGYGQRRGRIGKIVGEGPR